MLSVLQSARVTSSGEHSARSCFLILVSCAFTRWLYSVGVWTTAFEVTQDCVSCGQCQFYVFKMAVDTFPPRPYAYCWQLRMCIWKDEAVKMRLLNSKPSEVIFHSLYIPPSWWLGSTFQLGVPIKSPHNHVTTMITQYITSTVSRFISQLPLVTLSLVRIQLHGTSPPWQFSSSIRILSLVIATSSIHCLYAHLVTRTICTDLM